MAINAECFGHPHVLRDAAGTGAATCASSRAAAHEAAGSTGQAGSDPALRQESSNRGPLPSEEVSQQVTSCSRVQTFQEVLAPNSDRFCALWQPVWRAQSQCMDCTDCSTRHAPAASGPHSAKGPPCLPLIAVAFL